MSEVNSPISIFAVIVLTLPAVVVLQRARKFNIYFPHQSENSSLSSFIHYNVFLDFTENLTCFLPLIEEHEKENKKFK